MAKDEIKYGSKKIELSRVYPFGNNDGDTTAVTVTELTGQDYDNIANAASHENHLHRHVEIMTATGLIYEDVIKLAKKDIVKIMGVLENF